MKYTPYAYWSRGELYEKLLPQALDTGVKTRILKEACYDDRWIPSRDFNGCSVIQDPLHPYLPCFIHDYRWVTGQGGNLSDIEFRNNLIKAGLSKVKAWRFYFAVRLGWLFYFKWKYLIKNARK